MKKLFTIIFLFLILTLNAEAQTVTWQRAYGDPNIWESGYSIVQLPDEGYIAVGEENNFGFRSIAIRLDKFGNVVWEKNYPGRISGDIVKYRDGNYLLAGDKLIKININGDTIWTRDAVGTGFKFTNDGGFYFCSGKLVTPTRINPYLRKYDSLGYLQWERIYSKGIYDGIFSGDMIIDENNDLVLIGNYSDSAYIKDYPFIMKTDSLGNSIWFHGYNQDSMKYRYISQIQLNKFGEFVVGGANSYCYFISFSSQGYLLRMKYFESSYDSAGSIASLIRTNDNGFAFTGFYYLDPAYKVRLIKTNDLTDVVWTKLYGTEFGPSLDAKCVKQTSDSGYIIIGKREINNRADFLIIKTDKNGYADPPLSVNNNFSLMPQDFILYQNYPNPFNPVTEIKFELNINTYVELTIYDINGKEITKLLSKYYSVGYHSIKFNPSDVQLSSGIYFYKLNTNNLSVTKKLLFIK